MSERYTPEDEPFNKLVVKLYLSLTSAFIGSSTDHDQSFYQVQ